MRKTVLVKAKSLCCVIAICLAFSLAMFAQSDVGTITGFVRDQSGAVVPQAKVTIKSEATNEERVVTTDASGHYTVPNLLPWTLYDDRGVYWFQEVQQHAQQTGAELYRRSRR